jgi:hypothetical protein
MLAIGYFLYDLKGINLALCKHKFHSEEDVKHGVASQWRLYPRLKEMVRK